MADLPENDIGSPSGSGLTNSQCLTAAEANLVATSIVSSDDYALTDPWHASTCAGANCIYLYGSSAANMRALAGPTQPVWSFIESGTDDLGLSTQNGVCNWTTNLCASGNEAAATPVQVNSAAWDAIINGANGIEWFCDAADIGSTGTTNSGTTAYDACTGGGGDGSPVGGSTVIPANLTYIDSTVTSYAPELNSADVTGMTVSSSSSSVPVVDMLKQVNGEDYLFVESDRDGSTVATYSDPSLAGLTATLVYDSANRYDPASSEQGQAFTFSSSGTFSDSLGTAANPYQVKIYAIAGQSPRRLQLRRSPRPQLRRSPRPQLRRSPRPQLRRSPRPQLRRSPRPQLRRSPRPQLRRSPRPQLRRSPRPQLRRSPRPQLRRSPRPQLRRSPRPQLRRSPRPQLRRSPRPQLRRSPRPQLRRSPRPQLRRSPRPQLRRTPRRRQDRPGSSLTRSGFATTRSQGSFSS